MKFCAIHIQTGGTNHKEHSLLEFAAIVEDTNNPLSYEKIPRYNVIVKQNVYHGDPYALYYNREIFNQLQLPEDKRQKKAIPVEALAQNFQSWLVKHINTKVKNTQGIEVSGALNADGVSSQFFSHTISVSAAGKNFANFQLDFIKRIPHIDEFIQFNHRFLDPSILFWDPKSDEVLPSSEECKRRAGLENIEKHNESLLECWDIIQLFRKSLNY